MKLFTIRQVREIISRHSMLEQKPYVIKKRLEQATARIHADNCEDCRLQRAIHYGTLTEEDKELLLTKYRLRVDADAPLVGLEDPSLPMAFRCDGSNHIH